MTAGWEHPRHPAPVLPPRKTDYWRIFGIVLFVVIGIAGLAFVAVTILFVVAMSNYGSNK